MDRKEKDILMTYWEKIIPLFASIGSILAFAFYFFKTGNFDKYLIEPLLAVIASILGVVISFTFLKILKQKREGNIFISYSHKDKKFVEKLVQSLKVKRFNIFYDDEVINIGDNIKETIIDNIKKCDLIIIVLSENEKNDFLNYELKLALENNKKIIPIIIEDKVNIPDELKQIKYADFSKEYENNLRQLTKSLVSNLEKKSN